MKYTDKITISKKDWTKILSFMSSTNKEAADIHPTYRKSLPWFFQYLNGMLKDSKDLSKEVVIKMWVNLFSWIVDGSPLIKEWKCNYVVDIVRINEDDAETLRKKKELVSNIEKLWCDLNIDPENIKSLIQVFTNK